MECPHCKVAFRDDHKETLTIERHESNSYYLIDARVCPTCHEVIVGLSLVDIINASALILMLEGFAKIFGGGETPPERRASLRWQKPTIWPTGIARKPVPAEVPDEYAKDYKGAGLVLSIDADASAALSRRCLQHILRDKLKVKHGSLYSEIEQVISDPNTHSEVRESLHYLRTLGNFAAHPERNIHTGEIVSVEEDEAEWCLDVIEMMYEIYFVRPAKDAEMRQAIDAKKDGTKI